MKKTTQRLNLEEDLDYVNEEFNIPYRVSFNKKRDYASKRRKKQRED